MEFLDGLYSALITLVVISRKGQFDYPRSGMYTCFTAGNGTEYFDTRTSFLPEVKSVWLGPSAELGPRGST